MTAQAGDSGNAGKSHAKICTACGQVNGNLTTAVHRHT